MIIKLFAIGLFLLPLISCSSSKQNPYETTDDDGTYIFDEVPAGEVFQIDNKEDDLNYNFFVQIGAFATRSSAEEYSEESENILNKELEIIFNNTSYLYTVRLKELFNSRVSAENTRNNLWQYDKFKDAWIVKEHK